MGFACPVCETPQQDATHLANHLAFTAMVHSDEHEMWLDEHVPEWASHGEAELAPKVADLAEETDYEQVFEDTAHAHGHGEHDHAHRAGQQRAAGGGVDPEMAAAAGAGSLDEEAKAILEEARRMTAEMVDGEPAEDGSSESAEDDAESRD